MASNEGSDFIFFKKFANKDKFLEYLKIVERRI